VERIRVENFAQYRTSAHSYRSAANHIEIKEQIAVRETLVLSVMPSSGNAGAPR
jgi:hypothetical protein